MNPRALWARLTGRWGQALAVLAVFWALFVLVVLLPMMCSVSGERDALALGPLDERLDEAVTQMKALRKQNEQLKLLFEGIDFKAFPLEEKRKLAKQIDETFEKTSDGESRGSFLEGDKSWRRDIDQKTDPSIEYEQVRRRVRTNILELWNFVKSEATKARSLEQLGDSKLVSVLQNILDLGVEHERSLLLDLDTLRETDGYEKWRESEAVALSDLVQRRLHRLQNPEDCSKAKKLICNLNKGCGYGCQLHHVVYCLVLAYATERTMILQSNGWKYRRGGWEQVFLPVSNTCTSPDGETKDAWPGKWYTQVLRLPIIDALSPRPAFLPLTIPADLAPRLERLHGSPPSWWIGQFLKFLLKPQPATTSFIEESIQKLKFKRPIVGVHVRRTDKVGTEAAYHAVDEYMKHVDEYYKLLELREKVDKRRIYLASDDPKVIIEAREKYPEYEIIGDANVAKTAAVSSRYTETSLNGIILDIHLLSRSDFLVCTFSSQVCRVAYEIMQTLHVDASDRFVSLDDIYYYGGQNAHNRIAVLEHDPKNSPHEMQLKKGDVIGIAGNHWNGYSKGNNRRSNQDGLFPSFKTIDKIEVADFPTYTDVPLVKQ